MLLQLSEWEVTSTSLSIGSTTKQGRRSRSNSTCSHESLFHHDLEAAVAIVPNNRGFRQYKRRKEELAGLPDDILPLVVVTTCHGISVVGQSHSPKLEDQQLRESTSLKYSSRPHKQSSFLPDGKKANIPRIPAKIDVRNDLTFALQNQNSLLVCWRSAGQGPDDKDACVARLDLPASAMSMDIFPRGKGMPYGTLRNGSFFIGVWEGSALKKHVFKSDLIRGDHHICTIMTKTLKLDSQSKSGGKRKAPQDNEEEYVLQQVFAELNGFVIVKNQLSFSVDENSLTLNEKESTVSRTIVLCQDLGGLSIDPTHTRHAHDGGYLAIAYEEVAMKTVVNGKRKELETRQHKLCQIFLADGQLTSEPFVIPPSIREIAFVSGNIIAAATIDSLSFYEVPRGILVRSLSVADIVSDAKDWRLATDCKKGIIFVLSSKADKLQIAMSSLSGNPVDPKKFTLADGLRSAMISNAHLVIPGEAPSINDLIGLLASKKKRAKAALAKPKQTPVADALGVISGCIDKILDPKGDELEPNFLLNVYEDALSKALPPSALPAEKSSSKEDPKKPTQKFDRINLSLRGRTPPDTPQDFVDGATTLMLAALQLPRTENKVLGVRIAMAKVDARLIIYRLIQSGKVSARRHFQLYSEVNSREYDLLFSIFRAMKLKNKGGDRVVSPVDLMHELLLGCHDLTERHLVTMIHYMMTRALPEDVAETFIGWKPFDETNKYRKLAKNLLKAKTDAWKLESATNNDEAAKAGATYKEISIMVLRAGLCFLVERILTYSKVNEPLLSAAFAQGLMAEREPSSLANALLDILDRTGTKPGCQLAATKWLFILCEACKDRLLIISEKGKSSMTAILERIQTNVELNGYLVTIPTTAIPTRKASVRSKSSLAHKPKKLKMTTKVPVKDVAVLGDYVIEEFTF